MMNEPLLRQAALLLAAIGMVLLLGGGVMLLIRFLRRRRTHRKYTAAKLTGLIAVIVGPILTAGNALLLIYSDPVTKWLEQAYYTQYRPAEETLSQTYFSLQGGEDLEFHGETYLYVPYHSMTVRLLDPYRDAPVANLQENALPDSRKITAFSYNDPSGADMIGIEKRLYCRESDVEQLLSYYNHSVLHYQYAYTEIGDGIGHTIGTDFSNDWFGAIMEQDASSLSLCSTKFYMAYADTAQLETTCTYILQQTLPRRLFCRSVMVFLTADHEVYLSMFSDLTKHDNAYSTYQVTDPDMAKQLLEIGGK